jgi:hypothetical protein
MPRPKLSEEEFKARKQQRNKAYYQKTKEIVKERYKNRKEGISTHLRCTECLKKIGISGDPECGLND